MKKVAIYDPAMCCDTGVCGPVVDPVLTELASAVHTLKKKGISVERFNLTNDPQAFVDNVTVNSLLFEKGAEVLPLVLVDGELAKTGEYPTATELADWYGIAETELKVSQPKHILNIKPATQGAE